MSGNRISEPPTVTSRVLAILDSFTLGRSLCLAEISRRTGLASSTTHRLVGERRAWERLNATNAFDTGSARDFASWLASPSR